MNKFIEDYKTQDWQYMLIEMENNSGSTNFVLQLIENSLDDLGENSLAFRKLVDDDVKIIYVGNEFFAEKELDKVRKLKKKSSIYFLINQTSVVTKAKELVETSRYNYIILDNVKDLFNNSQEIIELYETIVSHQLKLIVCKPKSKTISQNLAQRFLNGADLFLTIGAGLISNTYDIRMNNNRGIFKNYNLKIE